MQMKRTILIPTDFSIESLKFLVEAVQSVQIGSVNVVFLHCAHLPNSIVDLLLFSKKELIKTLVTPAFDDACKVIRSKYESKINSLRIEIFTGFTQAAFENFLEGNKIDEAFTPKGYQLQLPKNSFDPMPFINRSGLPITEVTWKQVGDTPEKNQLAELFLI